MAGCVPASAPQKREHATLPTPISRNIYVSSISMSEIGIRESPLTSRGRHSSAHKLYSISDKPNVTNQASIAYLSRSRIQIDNNLDVPSSIMEGNFE